MYHHQNVVVKDNFRRVTFHNNKEALLCTECLDRRMGILGASRRMTTLIAVIVGQYEDVQCDNCSAVSAAGAYYDEITVNAELENRTVVRHEVKDEPSKT